MYCLLNHLLTIDDVNALNSIVHLATIDGVDSLLCVASNHSVLDASSDTIERVEVALLVSSFEGTLEVHQLATNNHFVTHLDVRLGIIIVLLVVQVENTIAKERVVSCHPQR